MTNQSRPIYFLFFLICSIILSIFITLLLMIILWLLCNALVNTGSIIGVYLSSLISPISIFIGAAIAFRLTLKNKNYKIVKITIGTLFFILGMAGSFFFPPLEDAVIKQIGWGISAGAEFNLGVAGTMLTVLGLCFAYKRQNKKVKEA